MSEVDCGTVLHMALTVSAEICAGARATIRAAEIQAKATRHAGNFTLLAGVFAVIAAVTAARMQVTIDWARESARSAKFYSKLRKDIISIEKKLYIMKTLLGPDANVPSWGVGNIEDKLLDLKSDSENFKSVLEQESNPLKGKILSKYENISDNVIESIRYIDIRLWDLDHPQINFGAANYEIHNASNMEKAIDKTLESIRRLFYGRF